MGAFSDPLKLRDGLLLVGSSLLAWGVFGIGVIAPLNPSHGRPAPLDIVLFFVVPVAALAIAATLALNRAVRVLLIVQIALVLIVGGTLTDMLSEH